MLLLLNCPAVIHCFSLKSLTPAGPSWAHCSYSPWTGYIPKMCFKYTVVVVGSCMIRFRTVQYLTLSAVSVCVTTLWSYSARQADNVLINTGRRSPPHLGDVLHVALWAGEAVVAMTPEEGECEVWRCFGHSTAKHGRLSHSHSEASWPYAVTESFRVCCWNGGGHGGGDGGGHGGGGGGGGGTDGGDSSGGSLGWRRDLVWFSVSFTDN